MSDDTQNLAAVEAILSERDALHGWLVRLDAAGSSAPESVRARVREDYERRLTAVTDRLREHADTIGNRLAADRAEHEDLAARARASRDALAEAELRHAVGEYDSAQFERERGRHAGDLETYDLALAAVAERLARLEEVQALVRRAPAEREPEPPPAAEAPAASPSPAEDGHSAERSWLPEAAEPATTEPAGGDAPVIDMGRDEEADLLAIFEPVEEEEPAPEADRREDAPSSGAALGPLSFTPSGEAQRPDPAPADRSVRLSPSEQPPRFVRPSPVKGSELVDVSESRRRTAQQLDATGVELEPAPVLPEPEVAGEAGPRTLRCGECGAMNRPLEWYCEKCGAELTAV